MSYQFRADDGGRAMSKRSKQRNDCAVRAVAIATGSSYDSIYDLFAQYGRKSGRRTPKKTTRAVMDHLAGLDVVTGRYTFPVTAGELRLNARTFAERFPKGRYVVQFAGHLSACIDGTFYDEPGFDSYKCVYSAWVVDEPVNKV